MYPQRRPPPTRYDSSRCVYQVRQRLQKIEANKTAGLLRRANLSKALLLPGLWTSYAAAEVVERLRSNGSKTAQLLRARSDGLQARFGVHHRFDWGHRRPAATKELLQFLIRFRCRCRLRCRRPAQPAAPRLPACA
jgi:hypothetical protein